MILVSNNQQDCLGHMHINAHTHKRLDTPAYGHRGMY